MDIFDQVIALVKELPDLAIWILAIFYGFKVIVVGSIYGLIRYCVDRVATLIENIRAMPVVKQFKVDDSGLTLCVSPQQVNRLLHAVSTNKTGLHQSDIERAIKLLEKNGEKP